MEIFSVFLFLLNVNFIYSASGLIFQLTPYDRACFAEYFADKTLVIFDITTNTTEVEIKITNPEETYNHEDRGKLEYKHAFTTFAGGNHDICIINYSYTETAEIHFSMKPQGLLSCIN